MTAGHPHGLNMLEDGVAAVAFVGQHQLCLAHAQQGYGLGAVVHQFGGHEEVQRQAKFIGKQVDFGRQTSSGMPQSLVLADPWPSVGEPARWSNRSSGIGSCGRAPSTEALV